MASNSSVVNAAFYLGFSHSECRIYGWGWLFNVNSIDIHVASNAYLYLKACLVVRRCAKAWMKHCCQSIHQHSMFI